MKIMKTIERIPGGLMLVPLFLGAICNTLFPTAGQYLGSFSNGLIKGAIPILAAWFFCMGASIELKMTGVMLKKSGILVVTKVAVAWGVALIAGIFWHKGYMVESGIFSGFSILALVASMDMTNSGLYAALMNQYGSKDEAGAFVLMSLESGPLMTMLVLGACGVATFETRLFVGAVLPFLIGCVLGNLDSDLRKLFGGAVKTLIPFFGFALGNSIDLTVIMTTGIAGILLSFLVIIVTSIPLILVDKYLGGGNGTAGIAASSTAGAAVATPMLIAEMIPEFAPVAPSATAMVASSVIITSLVVPVITSLWAKKFARNIAA